MIDHINHLTNFEFVLFVLAVFTTVVQLALLVRLMFSRAGASLLPGYATIVLWCWLYFITR